MTGLFPWLFIVAICLHNAEECIWLPAWSKTKGRFRLRIDARPFRFAAAILTALALACVVWATGSEAKSLAWHVLAAYALAMALNVFVPHLAVTLIDRRYVPGTATGVFMVLPACVSLVLAAFRDGLVEPRVFAAVAPVVIGALALSVPLLQAAGRRLFAA